MAFFKVLGEWEEKPHDAWERDGVAPQCAIPGLDWNAAAEAKYGRIKFQGKADFVQAHVSASYGWVLNNIDEDQDGYVQPR